MLPHHQPDRVRIAFDDHRLVANAGLILPSTPVYPGVGGEPTPDDIGPGQVSRPVVRPGPARHVPSRALGLRGHPAYPQRPRVGAVESHESKLCPSLDCFFQVVWNPGHTGAACQTRRHRDVSGQDGWSGETGYHDPGSSGRHFPWAPYGWVCGPHSRTLRQGLPVGSGGVRSPPPAPGEATY